METFFDAQQLVSEIQAHLSLDEKARNPESLFIQESGYMPFRNGGGRAVYLITGSYDAKYLYHEEEVGRITIEQGNDLSQNCEEDTYEHIQLRLREPLKLKDNLAIPSLRITLDYNSRWGPAPKFLPRTDRKIIVRHVWEPKADFSKALQTEWFVRKRD